MVTANVRRSYRGVANTLEDRELAGVLALAGTVGAGILLGQEVNDRIMPHLNMPVEPQSASELGASAVVKIVAAAILVVAGSQFGTGGTVVAGGLAAGMLGLAGADVFSALRSGGFSQPRGISGGRARRPRRVQRAGSANSGSVSSGSSSSSTSVSRGARDTRVSAWS